jgi:Spy/CpxP family protein refolding chaperone
MSEPEQPKIKKVQITNEKNVTAKDISDEAKLIWSKCTKMWNELGATRTVRLKSLTKEQVVQVDALFEQIRKDHPQFYSAYPTVLRHMIQEFNYSTKAFEAYLAKLEKKSWSNDSERMDSYTEYAVLLMKELNKNHINLTQVNAFRKDYRDRLQKEHDEFVQGIKKYQQDIIEANKKVTEDKKLEYIAVLRRLGPNANIPAEKIENLITLIEGNLVDITQVERMIYGIRKVLAGEDPAKVLLESKLESDEAMSKKILPTISLPDDVDDATRERVTEIVKEASAK